MKMIMKKKNANTTTATSSAATTTTITTNFNNNIIRCNNDRIKLLALIGCFFMSILNLYSIHILYKYQEQQHQYLIIEKENHNQHDHLHHSPQHIIQTKSSSSLSSSLAKTTNVNINVNVDKEETTSSLLSSNNKQQQQPVQLEQQKLNEQPPPQQKPQSLRTTSLSDFNDNPILNRRYQGIMDVWKKIAETITNSTTTTRILTLVNPERPTLVNKNHITITAHLGISKLQRFSIMIERWNGPISAAIYITTPHEIQILLKFQDRYQQQYPQTEYHLLLDPNSNFYSTKQSYPYNVLRQLALDKCKTNYFVTMDVDFVTTINGHTKLLEKLPHLESALKSKTLMVLPAFERTEMDIIASSATGNTEREDWIVQHYKEVLPNDKVTLIKQIHDKKMVQFHGEFSIGHASTDYNRWFTTTKPYGVSSTSEYYYYIEYQVKYEPYILAYKPSSTVDGQQQQQLPKYWQGFHTYHYNKYSWFMELYFDGYEFAVLNDDYIVHLEHGYPPKQDMVKQELNKFRMYLKRKYNWTPKTLETVISKRMNYAEPYYDGPTNIPKLVGWEEQNGFVFGRIMGLDETAATTTYIKSKEFVGTAKIIFGTIAVNQTVTSRSGHRYYLSGEPLVRR